MNRCEVGPNFESTYEFATRLVSLAPAGVSSRDIFFSTHVCSRAFNPDKKVNLRKLTETLVATQTLSQSEYLQLLEEFLGHFNTVAFDVKAKHARVTRALPFRQLPGKGNDD